MLQSEQNIHTPLIIAGQFPPPVHGFSYITQQMTELLSRQYDTTVIDLVPHTKKNGISYHLRRLFLTIKGSGTIICHRFKKGKTPVYIACEGGLGLVYIVILAIAARLVGKAIILHHHSFNYVDKKIFLMSLLLGIMGKRVTHIFLCPLMGRRFATRYNRMVRGVTISNSAFVEDVTPPMQQSKKGKTLTIGLLSNLNEEKGLSLFIETLEKSLEAGLNVKGVLAGPPVSEKDRITIEDAKKKFGDKFDYLGPVYGKDKDNFFKRINIFLFPTEYVNEAQPTVIAESLSYGVPVLSYERGCICDQVGSCGSVFEKNQNFPESAVRWLKDKTKNIASLNQIKTASREAFLKDRKEALKTAKDLLQYPFEIIEPEKEK